MVFERGIRVKDGLVEAFVVIGGDESRGYPETRAVAEATSMPGIGGSTVVSEAALHVAWEQAAKRAISSHMAEVGVAELARVR